MMPGRMQLLAGTPDTATTRFWLMHASFCLLRVGRTGSDEGGCYACKGRSAIKKPSKTHQASSLGPCLPSKIAPAESPEGVLEHKESGRDRKSTRLNSS